MRVILSSSCTKLIRIRLLRGSFTLTSRERNVFLPDFHAAYFNTHTHTYIASVPILFSFLFLSHQFSIFSNIQWKYHANIDSRSWFKRNVISEWKNLLPLILLSDRYRSIHEPIISLICLFFLLFSPTKFF